MQEKELIAKIKGLKQIKPNQEWVFLAKNRILGLENSDRPDFSPNVARAVNFCAVSRTFVGIY